MLGFVAEVRASGGDGESGRTSGEELVGKAWGEGAGGERDGSWVGVGEKTFAGDRRAVQLGGRWAVQLDGRAVQLGDGRAVGQGFEEDKVLGGQEPCLQGERIAHQL